MHVLQLSWEYPPHIVGGLGRHVAELAPALVAEGMRVSLVAPLLRGGGMDEASLAGVRVRRVPPPAMESYDFPAFVSQTNWRMTRAAQALLASHGRPDLIHAHDWLVAEAAIALKHHWRVPLIATVHATERGRGRGNLLGIASQRINDLEWQLTYESWRVIVCSQFMAGQLHDYFRAPSDKIDVVPNGVNVPPDPFSSPEERTAFRRRFVEGGQGLAFYVGRIVYEKGLQVLLDAWPQVCAATSARLVIAGAGQYLEALKAQAAGLGLGGSVVFTGFIADDDRDRLFHAADVAIFPSLYEPFGIVALEAFASGCPTIVAAAGGLAEVVDPGQTGLVVPIGDAASLASAVIDALEAPGAARARAARALQVARAHYSWPQIAEQTSRVYRRVYDEWLAGSWGKEIIR